MSKLTNSIYKAVIKIYRVVPFKKTFCVVLKKTNFINGKFYKDFKFDGKFPVKVDAGNSFYMYHHGGTIENETFWKGLFVSWESDVGWIWMQLCRFSDIIVDIGANTGIYSLVSKSINPGSEVYAFEPSVNTFEKLALNNKINNFDIQCEQIALSNINGEQTFYDIPDANQTSASLSPEKLKNFKYYNGEIKEYAVNTLTLSRYIEANNIKKIDLIKMDIEMHEPEAVEGLGAYMQLYKPIVIIEILSDEVADKLNKLIGEDYIRLHLKENRTVELMPQFKVFYGEWNYMFFHKEMENKIRQNTTITW
jgi:FkbM family methyltransferase